MDHLLDIPRHLLPVFDLTAATPDWRLLDVVVGFTPDAVALRSDLLARLLEVN